MDKSDMNNECVIDSLKEMAIKSVNDSFKHRVFVNAIDLIHRLQGEIERLTEENKRLLERSTMWKHLHTEVCEENADLKNQVDELKQENLKLTQGKAIMLDNINDLNKLVQFPIEIDGVRFVKEKDNG